MRHSRIAIYTTLAALCLGQLLATPANAQPKIRVACVGDDTTYGFGLKKRERRSYPDQLQELLGENHDVRNFGVEGATLLLRGDKPYNTLQEFRNATEFQPNYVLIMLGKNDSKPQNWQYKDDFAADMEKLVDHFLAQPLKPRVVLCTPLPVYRDWNGINQEVIKGEMIPLLMQAARKNRTPVVDLHDVMSDIPFLFPDGIHPNESGATLIAHSLQAVLLQ